MTQMHNALTYTHAIVMWDDIILNFSVDIVKDKHMNIWIKRKSILATEKYIYTAIPNDTTENEEILIDNSTRFTKIYGER